LKTLFAAKIPLSRLDGDVAQQKLDLVQFASGIAAQTGTGSTGGHAGLDSVDSLWPGFPSVEYGQHPALLPPSGVVRNPKDRQQRSISLARESILIGNLQECSCLLGGEPVTQSNAEVLRSLDSPDAGREIPAEQARISGLVCEPPDRREPAVDRAWRKLAQFQVHSVAGNDGPVKR
jgi:hypothetical protein